MIRAGWPVSFADDPARILPGPFAYSSRGSGPLHLPQGLKIGHCVSGRLNPLYHKARAFTFARFFYLILSRPDSFRKPAPPYLSTVPVFAGHLLTVYKMDMACPVSGPSKNISRVSRLPAAVRSLYHKGSGRFPGPSGIKKKAIFGRFSKKNCQFSRRGKRLPSVVSVFPEGVKIFTPLPPGSRFHKDFGVFFFLKKCL